MHPLQKLCEVGRPGCRRRALDNGAAEQGVIAMIVVLNEFVGCEKPNIGAVAQRPRVLAGEILFALAGLGSC